MGSPLDRTAKHILRARSEEGVRQLNSGAAIHLENDDELEEFFVRLSACEQTPDLPEGQK